MQHSCYSKQWDPVGFDIVQYNESKIIKDVNYVKSW
jgi:hypothetical protein